MSETLPVLPQDPDELGARAILAVIALGLVVFAGTLGAVVGELGGRRASLHPQATPAPVQAPREVGIVDQTLVRQDERTRQQADMERRHLQASGWLDRDQRTARIPIDLAMRAVVEKEATK